MFFAIGILSFTFMSRYYWITVIYDLLKKKSIANVFMKGFQGKEFHKADNLLQFRIALKFANLQK